jgi:hypothetical protein
MAYTSGASGSLYTRLNYSAASTASALNAAVAYAKTKLTNVTDSVGNFYLPNIVAHGSGNALFINNARACAGLYVRAYGGVWVNRVNYTSLSQQITSKYGNRNISLMNFVNNYSYDSTNAAVTSRTYMFVFASGITFNKKNNYWVASPGYSNIVNTLV